MSAPLIHRDDHILIVRDWHDAPPRFEVQCPHVADPAKRRGTCAYLEHCGCDLLYQQDREQLEKLLSEDDDELELHDWINGCVVPVTIGEDGQGKRINLPPDSPARAERLKLLVPEHTTCPRTGLKHHVWEGEIMTSTGPCGVTEEVHMAGDDILQPVELDDGRRVVDVPGRYPITFTWDEDGIEISIARDG